MASNTAVQQTTPHPPQSQPGHSASFSDTDPVAKFQSLLPILRESVTNLIREAVFIMQNTTAGQCKQSDTQALNKSMEDFYNISDQIEQWLVLANSTVHQNLLGNEFSSPVTASITTPNDPALGPPQEQDVLFYSHYLLYAKRHVAAANKLDSLLADFADSLCTNSVD